MQNLLELKKLFWSENKNIRLEAEFMNKKIAVLLPCYNESATIEKVVKDFRAALPEAKIYFHNCFAFCLVCGD